MFIVMSGWFLLASAIVQYQRKIKLLNYKKKIKISKKCKIFVNFARGCCMITSLSLSCRNIQGIRC